jgi:hypothetical protein
MFSFATRLTRMSDAARTAVCRLAFLAFCLVPTLLVLAWCLSHYLPGRAETARRQLAERLGVEVELAAVEFPRPGVTRFKRLKLYDPELGELLLSLDGLEVADDGARLMLLATKVEIEDAGLRRLWELLNRRMRFREPVTLRLRAPNVTCRQGRTLHWLTDVQALLEPTEAGSQAVVAWRLAGLDMERPHRLGVVRDRQTSPPATEWQLETGPTPVPCTLVAGLLPEAARLGDLSRFRGSLYAKQTPDGWVGAMAGRLHDVDLKRALAGVFPHPLTGKAQVAVERATFRFGRLETLQAALTAAQGSYGRSLITAAVEHLGMELATRRELLPEAEPYRQLGLRVRLDASGLKLAGNCSGSPDAVLVSRWGTVLNEPPPAPLPLAAILRMFSPDAAATALVPLSRASAPVARVLPLPERARGRGGEGERGRD